MSAGRYARRVQDKSIPVVLCFDVEPDLHTFDPDDPSPWRGFEQLIEALPELRAGLERATGGPPRFNWAVRNDPQIARCYGAPSYVLRRYASFFDDALRAGDAIGVHPHAWRWRRAEARWVSDHADEAWVHECLEMAVSTYADEFGHLPTFHRYGMQWMSTATMNRLRELGVTIDLTVEPGSAPMAPGPLVGGYLDGSTPDCRLAPRRPYHPDVHDFRRAAAGRREELWAVPLTAGRTVLAPLARHLPLGVRAGWYLRHPVGTGQRALQRASARVGRSQQAGPPVTGEHTLAPVSGSWPSPEAFWGEAVRAARQASRAAPYLAFAVRTSSFIDPVERELLDLRMKYVVEGLVHANLVFALPGDVLADAPAE
jgi:hypothetical protein